MPERAERAARLSMQPRPFRIEEHRIADLHLDVAIAHRIIGAHALTDALRPVRDHSQSDPVAEHWRERDRGHVALVILDPWRRSNWNEMRACAQPRLAIDRTKARERRPILGKERGSLRHDAADAIFLRRYQPAEAKIARGELPVDLVAGHVALFDAHHAKRFGAVRADP